MSRCHTFTGVGFDPFRPRTEDVRLGDIAHHLAMTARFGGAAPVFYSVAEHAVRVAHLVERISGDPLYALHALHHDSAEAYLGDIRRPLKPHLHLHMAGPIPFDSLEGAVLVTIVAALGIPLLDLDPDCGAECNETIAAADDAILAAEFRCFFPDSPEGEAIQERTRLQADPMSHRDCLPWQDARTLFLTEHNRLTRMAALLGAQHRLPARGLSL